MTLNPYENNLLCLKYSVPVFLVAIGAVGTFFSALTPEEVTLTQLGHIYLFSSLLTASAIFLFRIFTRGLDQTFNTLEFSIASLSAVGLSLPIAFIGIFLASIGRRDYSGAEKWFPEIKNPEQEIQRLIVELDLSEDVHDRSIDLLETISDYELLSGRSAAEISAAIIYISAREQNEPRTLEEISKVASASKKEIGRVYRQIGRNTDIRIIPPQPVDHLDRFTEQLNLSNKVKETAKNLIEEAKETNIISGKSPKGIAASSIYLAAYMEDEKRTMNDMSNTIGITTITIRNRSKDLIDALNLEKYPEHLRD